ncbi:SnoaL-like domain-containing protein [Sphingobium faniae]|nr:SnoaL-like domain-containing protein [Sphingobium faniae]
MSNSSQLPADGAARQWFAIDAVRNLKSRYFRTMDGKDWAGLAMVFAPDADFDARCSFSLRAGDDSPAGRLAADWHLFGREAIVDFIRAGTQAYVTVHHGHGHEVVLDGPDDAHGVIAMEDFIFEQRDGAMRQLLHGMGHYHERYRRIDGCWYILSSRISRLYVDYTPLPGDPL